MITICFSVAPSSDALRWQSDLGDGSFDSSTVSYVTPGLGKKVRFCQVFQEDQLFTGTITEGDKVCQYINTETKEVGASSDYKVRKMCIDSLLTIEAKINLHPLVNN